MLMCSVGGTVIGPCCSGSQEKQARPSLLLSLLGWGVVEALYRRQSFPGSPRVESLSCPCPDMVVATFRLNEGPVALEPLVPFTELSQLFSGGLLAWAVLEEAWLQTAPPPRVNPKERSGVACFTERQGNIPGHGEGLSRQRVVWVPWNLRLSVSHLIPSLAVGQGGPVVLQWACPSPQSLFRALTSSCFCASILVKQRSPRPGL